MSGPDDLFSHTVPEAHAKFVAACDVAGATTRVIEHPLSGPDGEPLHATVARLGPDDARDVMLVISGTHGIEGYFGSAMQIDAMRRSRDLLPLDDHTAVVMVKPAGTGNPMLDISARPAPFPPSNSFISLVPSVSCSEKK